MQIGVNLWVWESMLSNDQVERRVAQAAGMGFDVVEFPIEERSVPEAVRAAGDTLGHVHACGNDRGAPGNGHIPWDDVAAALADVGYDDQVIVESFTPAVESIARAAAIWRPLESTQDALARDGLAFLMLSVGVTGVLLWVGMTALGGIGPLLGLPPLEFGLFAAGSWAVALIQFYLVVVFLSLLAFVTVEATCQYLGSVGDYESSLAVVCYGLAPIVLLFVPQVSLGFGIVTLVSPAVTALVVVVPVVLAVAWLMHAGVVELHGLSRRRALVPVLGTLAVWLAVGAWVAIAIG